MGLPVLSIIGYTNAGKSTLMNHLSSAEIYAADELFATLDPTTRRVKLPGAVNNPEVLMTDTVGFIQKLPTTLVAAFRATLEEVKSADVLVHVIDVSSPSWEKREQSVLDTLEEIGCGNKPIVRVLNKIDAVPEFAARIREAAASAAGGDTVAISSTTGEGMSDFVKTVERAFSELLVDIEVVIPYSRGEDVSVVNEVGIVSTVDYREDGTYMIAKVPMAVKNRLKEWSLGEDGEEEVVEETEEMFWERLNRMPKEQREAALQSRK